MKKAGLLFILIVFIISTGCDFHIFNSKKWKYDEPVISRQRGPFLLEPDSYEKRIPRYEYRRQNGTGGTPIFLSGCDLRNIDLSSNLKELTHVVFDTKTQWPQMLPEGFIPSKIMENGKNPGLGINSLREKKLTGKNVSIAVIGEPLYIEHEEYKERIKLYEEIGMLEGTGSTESSAIVSKICGKTTGIAPEADIFYIAVPYQEMQQNGEYIEDYMGVALGVDRIIEINKTLPENRRIRMIFTWGIWRPGGKNEAEYLEAVQRAVKEGIDVITNTGAINGRKDYRIAGAGRDPMTSPDDRRAYTLPISLENLWYSYDKNLKEFMNSSSFNQAALYVPSDCRTAAFPTGPSEYLYQSQGSFHNVYIAGLYALACQADSNCSIDEFMKGITDTSEAYSVNLEGNNIIIGRLVNPIKFFEYLDSK